MAIATKPGEIRNFQQIESFIKDHPDEAQMIAAGWQKFLKTRGKTNPEIYTIKTSEEWYDWVRAHPELNVNPNYWQSKEVNDAMSSVRYETSRPQEQQNEGSSFLSSIGSLGTVGVGALMRPDKAMQTDGKYQRYYQEILTKKAQTWAEMNPGKKVADYYKSKEFLDYKFGSLDNPTAGSLDKDAEALFRERHPKEAEKYDKQLSQAKKNPHDDASYRYFNAKTNEEIGARLHHLETEHPPKNKEEKEQLDAQKKALAEKIQQQRYEAWVEKHPEKAEAYKKKDEHIQKALDRIEARKTQSDSASPSSSPPQQAPTPSSQQNTPQPAAINTIVRSHAAATPPSQKRKPSLQAFKSFTKSFSQNAAARIRSFSPPSQQSGNREINVFRPVSDVIDTANNVYQKYREAQNAMRILRTGNQLIRGLLRGGGMVGQSTGSVVTGATSTLAGATGGSGLAAATPIIIIAAIVILFIIIFVVVIGCILGIFPDCKAKNPTPLPTIPGLLLRLTGPTLVQNTAEIQYQVSISYNPSESSIPIESITVYDDLPPNTELVAESKPATCTYNPTPNRLSCPLLEPANQSGFTFRIKPTSNDIAINNKVYATTTGASSGGSSGSPTEGGSGNACTAQYEGKGYCSVANLTKYFNGDTSKALIASMICKIESNSNPNNENKVCPDYSIGLFQINLLAHCPAGRPNALACTFADIAERDKCEVSYKDPENNIQKMVSLSQNGTNWNPWSAYTDSRIGVKKKLAECGIN